MRVVGWCERCHRIKYVRVDFSRSPAGGVYVGVCYECERGRR